MESTIIELCRSGFGCEMYSLGVELWIIIIYKLLHSVVPPSLLCKSYKLWLQFWFFFVNHTYSISTNASYPSLSSCLNLINIIPSTQNNLCFAQNVLLLLEMACVFLWMQNNVPPLSNCIIWSTIKYSLQKLPYKGSLFKHFNNYYQFLLQN